MAALNFPDPNVTTTYTNPDTGITYEWSNNTWKAIRSAQTAPELFVDYDGDNMTGDLTFNTDKIVLGATFGTGTFAGNIGIGGDVTSSTAGGVEITSTGTVIANRIGGANPVSYADCFVGRYNGVDTCEIKADGSATFASPSASTGGVEVSRYGVYIRSDDSYPKAFAIHNGGYTASDETILFNSDGSAAFSSSITAQNTILANRTGSTQTAFQATLSGVTKVNIQAGGSATFAGNIYSPRGYVERLDIGQNGPVPGGNALTITNSGTLTTTLRSDGSALFGNTSGGSSGTGGMEFSPTNGQLDIINTNSGNLITGYNRGSTSQVFNVSANGSASFAGPIDINTTTGGTNVLRLESSGANSYGLMCKAGGASAVNYYCDFRDQANNSVFKIDGNGTATFDGVLTGNQRVVINQAGGKTGSAHTLLNYAGDGTTVTASFTADGVASFESSVTSKYSGQGQVQTAASIVHGVMVKDTGGNINATLDWDGSASFAGFVDVSDKTYQSAGNGGVYIGQNQNGGHINVYKDSDTATVADDGSFLRCYSASNDTSTKTEKISLLADGSATFSGPVNVIRSQTASQQSFLKLGDSGNGGSYFDFLMSDQDGGADHLAHRKDGYVGKSTYGLQISSSSTLSGSFTQAGPASIKFFYPSAGGGAQAGGQLEFWTNQNGYAGTSETKKMQIDNYGNIGAPSGNNIYNASDERLKENISDLTECLEKVKNLRPISFTWKDGFGMMGGVSEYGFGAQTTQVVDEMLVESFGEDDIVLGEETIENPLRVNDKYMIPILVKALQEATSKIETLESKVAALEAG